MSASLASCSKRSTIAIVSALLIAGSASAQMGVAPPQWDPATQPQNQQLGPDPYGQNPYGAQEPHRPNTRSLFVATIAALLAQGIGNGLATGLAQGLAGSIVKWFNGSTADPGQDGQAEPPHHIAKTQRRAQGAASASGTSSSTGDETGSPRLHAGFAFEVHRLAPGGGSAAIDSSTHVFRTGEQFVVHYRPTLPGRVEVFNIDPKGKQARIDASTVAAGELASLGPYQFVATGGTETLKIMLSPCTTPALAVATRKIVNVSSASKQLRTPVQLASCGDAQGRVERAAPRSITKVTTEGGTVFALDPVLNTERASGALAPRVLAIRLQHR